MKTRYSKRLRAVEDRMLDGPGTLDRVARRTIAEGGSLGHPIVDAFLEKVRNRAYAVVDRDIDVLRSAGWSEDQIFELSICAAYGEARRRLDVGLGAVGAVRRGDQEAVR